MLLQWVSFSLLFFTFSADLQVLDLLKQPSQINGFVVQGGAQMRGPPTPHPGGLSPPIAG